MPGVVSEESAYARMLGRLFEARRGGVKLELDRMRACLDRLGSPDRAPRLRVQVAGTNGKGSTVAFAASILTSAGLRVGRFTSPHLNALVERFVVDGEAAQRSEVLAAEARVRQAQDPADPLTFFEQVTAIALCIFASRGVDVAVLEVGLGGRYDATTAVTCEVAAVTGVAMDHQDYLGDSLQEIAAEKAAVFRAGQRAVVGAAGVEAATPWLVEAARVAGVRSLALVGAAGAEARIETTRLGIGGAWQRVNAACAALVVDEVATVLGHPVSAAQVRAGLAAARLPGRFERVHQAPTVVLDGAHNPHAAHALARELATSAPEGYVLVLGASDGKDVAQMVAPLVEQATGVILTRSDNPRAMAPEALSRAMAGVSVAWHECVDDVGDAISLAMERAGAEGTVVVTGSLFLVGQARRSLCGDAVDPVPVSDPV